MFFRVLGGPGAVRITAAARSASSHRLTLRQRLGLGDSETLERPAFDGAVLALPGAIDCFPDRELNEQLYLWLAAYFAHTDHPRDVVSDDDPLRADLRSIARAIAASHRVLTGWPGLARCHAALAAATRSIRPQRELGGAEAAIEQAIDHHLGGPRPADAFAQRVLAAIETPTADYDSFSAPRGYRAYLPVPLWGDVVDAGASRAGDRDAEPGNAGADASERRHKARHRKSDQASRKDSLIFNRFEYLLSIAEMLNINRSVDDDDPDAALQAAESVDEITLSDHERNTSSRVKLDLELAPPDADPAPLVAEYTYPEWDYRRGAYHDDHCRVIATVADGHGEDWQPDAAARRRIRRVRRQFEALRPRRRVMPGQPDGDELDLSALIRSRADQRSGQPGTDRVFREARNVARDLSVALLVDGSLSTDSYVDNRRVLDVEKEAVLALMHGLEACGDDNAVFAFTSRERSRVDVATIKHFDEPVDECVRRRLCGLKPGFYTRIGAALRHVAAELQQRATRHRLLLLITDGKPNDMDHYEGRYGVEDTRRAVRDARRAGLAVFGITVDRKARDYIPYLFGRGSYAIVRQVGRLPDALPAIYRNITR